MPDKCEKPVAESIHFDVHEMRSGMLAAEDPKDWEKQYIMQVVDPILFMPHHPQHQEVTEWFLNDVISNLRTELLFTSWNIAPVENARTW